MTIERAVIAVCIFGAGVWIGWSGIRYALSHAAEPPMKYSAIIYNDNGSRTCEPKAQCPKGPRGG